MNLAFCGDPLHWGRSCSAATTSHISAIYPFKTYHSTGLAGLSRMDQGRHARPSNGWLMTILFLTVSIDTDQLVKQIARSDCTKETEVRHTTEDNRENIFAKPQQINIEREGHRITPSAKQDLPRWISCQRTMHFVFQVALLEMFLGFAQIATRQRLLRTTGKSWQRRVCWTWCGKFLTHSTSKRQSTCSLPARMIKMYQSTLSSLCQHFELIVLDLRDPPFVEDEVTQHHAQDNQILAGNGASVSERSTCNRGYQKRVPGN